MPFESYVISFVHLLIVPFRNLDTTWDILPVYTSLILGEMYKSKVSFAHAVGNGFVMLWAGLNWSRHLSSVSRASYMIDSRVLPWAVTAACIGLGVFTIILGLRKKDKGLCEILGHTRFSCYFILTLYPMQSGLVRWSWTNLVAVLVFALPCWFLIYLLGRLASRFVS